MKRVLRYVSGSRTMGICFDGAAELRALGYCDADWAGDVKDRKSTSGYIFMMGGSALSWASRKQTVVSTSSCEAEYIAMSTACKEGMWLKRLVSVFTSHTGKSDKMKFSVIVKVGSSCLKMSLLTAETNTLTLPITMFEML